MASFRCNGLLTGYFADGMRDSTAPSIFHDKGSQFHSAGKLSSVLLVCIHSCLYSHDGPTCAKTCILLSSANPNYLEVHGTLQIILVASLVKGYPSYEKYHE